MPMFSKILCPTDLSEASFEALKVAAGLLCPDTGELYVVYVQRDLTQFVRGGVIDAEAAVTHRAEAIRNLFAVVEERLPGARAHPQLREGDPGEEIALTAREQGVDLIVLTAHGAGGASGGEPGTVACEVLSASPCPVLLIRGKNPVLDPKSRAAILAGAASGMRAEFELVHAGEHAIFLDGD